MIFQECLPKLTNQMTIELDDTTAEKFKSFCQYEQELLSEHARWKELKLYIKQMQFGSFNLTIKDGLPYRVDKPMQTVILGIKV